MLEGIDLDQAVADAIQGVLLGLQPR
jgi:hypothetical protein